MRGCCLGRIVVFPSSAPGVRVSTFGWRFLAVGCEQLSAPHRCNAHRSDAHRRFLATQVISPIL